MIDLVKKINEENEIIEEGETIFNSEESLVELNQVQERTHHLCKNELGSKKESPTYQLIYSSKLKESERPLDRVIGHENQKKELLFVIGLNVLKNLKIEAYQFLKASFYLVSLAMVNLY